jgi:hypothetical protein
MQLQYITALRFTERFFFGFLLGNKREDKKKRTQVLNEVMNRLMLPNRQPIMRNIRYQQETYVLQFTFIIIFTTYNI